MTESVGTELVKRAAKAGMVRDMALFERFFRPETDVVARQSEFDLADVFEQEEFLDDIELVECEFDDVVVDGTEASVFATTEYRLLNEMIGVDAAGETYTTSVAMHLEFVDDGVELDRLRVVENREELLSTLGVLTDQMTGGNLRTDLVGDKIRLEYREVLARLLRHNVRNEAAVVTAVAERLQADDTTAALGAQLQNAADNLVGVADKAREIDRQLVSQEANPEPVDLRAVIAEVVDRHTADRPVTVATSVTTRPTLTTDRLLVMSALDELVENAVEHGGTAHLEVSVTVESTERIGYERQVTVEDDGPGIPPSELAPIRAGQETDLSHSTGLGLWKLKWCVDRLDGEVEFEQPQDGGTRARILLPTLEPAAST
jgi:signal transduction histidine kinase